MRKNEEGKIMVSLLLLPPPLFRTTKSQFFWYFHFPLSLPLISSHFGAIKVVNEGRYKIFPCYVLLLLGSFFVLSKDASTSPGNILIRFFLLFCSPRGSLLAIGSINLSRGICFMVISFKKVAKQFVIPTSFYALI
jgi:hypothetical protein